MFEDTQWYVHLEFRGVDGELVQVPHEDQCLRCGLGLLAYPGLTKEGAATKFGESKKWRLAFIDAGDKKVAQGRPSSARKGVDTSDDILVEVYVKFALVTVNIFTAKWMPPDKVPGIKIVKAPHPEGAEDLVGVLMDRSSVPDDLPHWLVRISGRRLVRLQNFVLKPEDIVRVGQAADTFTDQVAQEMSSRGTTMRASNLPHLETFGSIEAKVNKSQDDLARQEGQRNLQRQYADAGGIVDLDDGSPQSLRRLVAGSVQDEVDETEKPNSKKGGHRARGRQIPKAGARSGPSMCSPKSKLRGAVGKSETSHDRGLVVQEDDDDGEEENSALCAEWGGIDMIDVLKGGNWGRSIRAVPASVTRCDPFHTHAIRAHGLRTGSLRPLRHHTFLLLCTRTQSYEESAIGRKRCVERAMDIEREREREGGRERERAEI